MSIVNGIRDFIFGRPLPVVVSYATEPEEIVADVKRVKKVKSQKKSSVARIIKSVESGKLTEETIPDFIIAVTALSVVSLAPAYILNVPPVMLLVVFIAIHAGLVTKYRNVTVDVC